MGRLDVDRMLSEISSRQLTEWRAFFELNPWGEERADLRAARICQMLGETNRQPGARHFTIEEFMWHPDGDGTAGLQSDEEMRAIIEAFKAEARLD